MQGRFHFAAVPASDYFVMAFITWQGEGGAKLGGAAMRRIHVDAGSDNRVTLAP